MNKKYHMKKEIINRLEYVEETYAGELETWQDPVTKTYYHVPIEITRRWDESEALISDKANTMTHERKEEHIRNIAFCIRDGASGYVTDNFRIEDLPTPQIGRAQSELQSHFNLVCRLLLKKKKHQLRKIV